MSQEKAIVAGQADPPAELAVRRRSILVTGGTGSFGSVFTRIVLERGSLERLVVYSRDEHKQHQLQGALGRGLAGSVEWFLGDVRDHDRLALAMRGIDVVVHAAALKHVPASELHPIEFVRTNVLGADNVVRAALANEVALVIGLSTDKACSPVNLYGATKLAAEKIFIAANDVHPRGRSRFSVVRYGNVLGSNGSVVPLFRRLIAEGASSLPITDTRMTRFWITLEQAVHFVLDSMRYMQGREVFVPKLPSMRLVDLAQAMAPRLPHRIVGIRPGEKLHEAMIGVDDSRSCIDAGDRYVLLPPSAATSYGGWNGNVCTLVDQGFTYTSENNPIWLDRPTLRQLLAAS